MGEQQPRPGADRGNVQWGPTDVFMALLFALGLLFCAIAGAMTFDKARQGAVQIRLAGETVHELHAAAEAARQCVTAGGRAVLHVSPESLEGRCE